MQSRTDLLLLKTVVDLEYFENKIIFIVQNDARKINLSWKHVVALYGIPIKMYLVVFDSKRLQIFIKVSESKQLQISLRISLEKKNNNIRLSSVVILHLQTGKF